VGCYLLPSACGLTACRSSGMYMQEALELVCRKRRIPNPKDYALLLDDKSILIPMDRTVASLQGKRELVLIQKSMLSQYGIKGTGRTTDPNGRPHFIGYFTVLMELQRVSSSECRKSRSNIIVPSLMSQRLIRHVVNSSTSTVSSGFDISIPEIHCIPQDAHDGQSTRTNSCHRRCLYPCPFSIASQCRKF
jgi:hypothetical protein